MPEIVASHCIVSQWSYCGPVSCPHTTLNTVIMHFTPEHLLWPRQPERLSPTYFRKEISETSLNTTARLFKPTCSKNFTILLSAFCASVQQDWNCKWKTNWKILNSWGNLGSQNRTASARCKYIVQDRDNINSFACVRHRKLTPAIQLAVIYFRSDGAALPVVRIKHC